MSQQAVETIVGRAVLDAGFRSALLGDANAALAGYDLTGEESAALKAMNVEALESFAGILDQRISKSVPIGAMAEDGLWVDSATGNQRVMSASAPRGQLAHLPEGA